MLGLFGKGVVVGRIAEVVSIATEKPFVVGVIAAGLHIQNKLRSLNEKPFQSAIETLFAFQI